MDVIVNKQKELIEDINLLDDWEDKYTYIVEYGAKLPMIDEAKKTEEYLVKSCQSRL